MPVVPPESGKRHSSGLWCFPDADTPAATDEQSLCHAGYSRAKAQTLLQVARHTVTGDLELNAPSDALIKKLQSINGIVPWTINYTLLRGLSWMDASLHGDVAVRCNLQTLLNSAKKPGIEETRHWLTPFSP